MLFKPAGGKQPTPQLWPLPLEMAPLGRFKGQKSRYDTFDQWGRIPRASEYAFPQQGACLKPLKCSGGAAMMVMNLASPLEHFGGFSPAHCQGKAYTTKTLAAIDGGAYRQQSTKTGRGRNGEDDDGNGQGRQRQRARTTTMARKTTMKTSAAIDGGAHRQQSTKSGRGRNGEDDNDNGQGWQQQRARTTMMARKTTVRTMVTRWRRRQG